MKKIRFVSLALRAFERFEIFFFEGLFGRLSLQCDFLGQRSRIRQR